MNNEERISMARGNAVYGGRVSSSGASGGPVMKHALESRSDGRESWVGRSRFSSPAKDECYFAEDSTYGTDFCHTHGEEHGKYADSETVMEIARRIARDSSELLDRLADK